ncbi:prepilin-type N-terminal cleavage/methylation domain-containing protein [bacterium]|nr:prepilin-type N-terminal cleavage/methylation domain-containing protein [bacterium]
MKNIERFFGGKYNDNELNRKTNPTQNDESCHYEHCEAMRSNPPQNLNGIASSLVTLVPRNDMQVSQGIAIAMEVNKRNLKVHTFTPPRNDELCHSELVSESISKKTLKQVQGDKNRKAAFTLTEGPRRTGYTATIFGKTPRLLRSAGFTLAEVLITIGIIGVVAALTIPTLMANVKGIRNRTQFKKTISTLHQAVRMNKVEYEYDFSNTDCKSSCGSNTCPTEFIFDDIFTKNLKSVSCSSDYLDDLYSYSGTTINDLYYSNIHTLADGSLFVPVEGAGGACSKSAGESLNDFLENKYDLCTGVIDINGAAGPNKEVECSNDTTAYKPDNPCIVKNSDITDIFPVVFHDDIVEPATNAAKYVLNTAK